MTKAAATPAVAKRPSSATIDFLEPVVRGETVISTIMLNKPKGPALYGIRLPDIVGLDIRTLYRVIPLISEPPLTEDEAEDLDPSDLHAIGGAIRDFFMLKTEQELWAKMLEKAQSED